MLAVNSLNVGYGESRVIHDLSFKLGGEEILASWAGTGWAKPRCSNRWSAILPSKSGSIKLSDQEIPGWRLMNASAPVSLSSRRADDLPGAHGHRKYFDGRSENNGPKRLG